MDTLYPRLRPADDPTEGRGEVWMEIGFGAAHHLLHQARSNPDALVIGAEPFLNGVAKAVASVHEEGLENLRLHMGDAREVLARVPDGGLTRLFVLFPDPWPKARHHKRRLVQDDTIAEFARVLAPGGEFRFASDILSYVDWVLVRMARNPDFSWEPERASDFLDRPADMVRSRYEAKAVREGRTPHYFSFTRRGT